ncbi:hypothetical protein [uncultured Methylobacterium sp.]|jgi:hypothetical protein|uniref:hypothetical protein n=1 Tax=uncultured Methylobacterium sp. TaxID=157278 RepID=UPI00263201A1|nr:hypothetical protein [uncultured Methylobacterium sp.]
MSITFDEAWLPTMVAQTRARQVYRDGETVGRIRRWQNAEEGDVVREHFTAERFANAFYVQIEGEHATFEDALARLLLYGVAH